MCKRKWNLNNCSEVAKKYNGKCLSKTYVSISNNLLWECKEGHIWKASFKNVKNGHWCRKCYINTKRHTIENCQKIALKRGGKCLSGEYINNSTDMVWECKNGHKWPATFSSIKNGHSWCLKCSGKAKLSITDCVEFAKKFNGECLSRKYINNSTFMKWRCKNGHIWKSAFGTMRSLNSWCKQCGPRPSYTIKDCCIFAKNKNGKCLSKTYVNSYTKLKWMCKNGHTWFASFSRIKHGWCPQCSPTKKLSLNDCIAYAKSNDGKCLSKTYINGRSAILWQCKNGHTWKQKFIKMRKKRRWCAICSLYKTQKYLTQIVSELFKKYEIKNNYRSFDWLRNDKTGYPLEIDIYIPKLKLAIEYDGKHHFEEVNFGNMSKDETKERLKYTKKLDKIKNKKIKKHPGDIKYFIRFNYKENINKEYVKNKINQIFMKGKNL